MFKKQMQSGSTRRVWTLTLLLPVLASAAAPGSAPAASTSSQPPGPRIQFSNPVFDFGKVYATNVLQHDFVFTNTGDALLVISNVNTTCGCTTITNWDRQVPPGKTGRIPVRFTPANASGPVVKSVTVVCNDSTQPSRVLQVRVTVQRPFEVLPGTVIFTQIEGEATNEVKVVRIFNNLEEDASLEPPVCTNPMFTAELKTVRPGREFELGVRYNRSATNAQGTITLHTSSTNTPVLTIPAVAMWLPAIAVMPLQVNLLPVAGTNHSYAVTIRNNSRTPLKLSDVGVNAEGVRVDLLETVPGKLFSLRLAIPPDFQLPTNRPVLLSVNTSDPNRPAISIPIVQSQGSLPLRRVVKGSSGGGGKATSAAGN